VASQAKVVVDATVAQVHRERRVPVFRGDPHLNGRRARGVARHAEVQSGAEAAKPDEARVERGGAALVAKRGEVQAAKVAAAQVARVVAVQAVALEEVLVAEQEEVLEEVDSVAIAVAAAEVVEERAMQAVAIVIVAEMLGIVQARVAAEVAVAHLRLHLRVIKIGVAMLEMRLLVTSLQKLFASVVTKLVEGVQAVAAVDIQVRKMSL